MNSVMGTRVPSAPGLQRRSSLRADFSWTLVGNAVYAAGQWLTLILLAKLTRPELVGQYAWGCAIAIPVFTLASLQLRLAVVSDIYEQTRFGCYLGLRLLTTVLALVTISSITQVFGYGWQVSAAILLVGVAQAIEGISDIYYARLQLHDRMICIAKSMIARTGSSALALTAGLYFTRRFLWGLAGIVLARAIVLLAYDIRESTHNLSYRTTGFFRNAALKPSWDSEMQSRVLRLSLPLSIIAVLVSLNFTIPRYFVEHALGERALGIFSAITVMFVAGSMAVTSLGQSVFTRLVRSYATENFAEFRSLLVKLIMVAAGLGMCGIIVAKVAGREIITILFRPEYAEQADLLPWLMVVGCVGYMGQFLGYGMTAARYYRGQVILFVLTDLIVAIACYVLVPSQGLLGAIFAMLIAASVQLAGSIIILAIGMRKHDCALARRSVGAAQPDVVLQA